jgi:hypothetical protein
LDILPNGEEDLPTLKQHFNDLHTNLEWEFNQGREGAYLDLWVMIKDGKIETRRFTKSEPIYIGPKSCHDPKVFKSIFTGVGLRLRLNCSKDADFDSAVEKYSRALAVSGFKFQKAKSELMKSKSIIREEYLKEEKNRKQNQKTRIRLKCF